MRGLIICTATLVLISPVLLLTTVVASGEITPPNWSNELIKAQFPEGGYFKATVTINIAPKYYPGRAPLTFEEGQRPMGMGMGSLGNMVLYQDFGTFRNYFIYRGPGINFMGFPQGAQTRDTDGYILAEARYLDWIRAGDGPVTALIIEEFHYGAAGKITFYCKSKISFPRGEKIAEYDQRGKKQQDYYFLWPCGI